MSKARILVVDDNVTNLKLAARTLEFAGHAVATAHDAETALAMLLKEPVDLVLLDIELPGMDGLELTRKLKANEQTRHIAVIALTAYAMKGDEDKAFAAGCDGYITKPINTREFAGQIARYLPNAQP